MADQDVFVRSLSGGEAASAYDVRITGAGRATIVPEDDYLRADQRASAPDGSPHGSATSEFKLVLLSDGAGKLESELTGRVSIEGAALVFVTPGVAHRYWPDEGGWTERWISFDGDLVERLLEIGRFGAKMAVVTPCDAERLAGEFDDLLDAIDRQAEDRPAAMIYRALGILATAIAEMHEGRDAEGVLPESAACFSTIDDPIVERALELIWTESHEPMSVSDIARHLPVTRRTLDRRFSDAVGHSVLEEISVCRLRRAKQLLIETDLPVKTIARQAGYSSTERMRVAFVEREGTSPSNFRKRMLDAGERAERPDKCDARINAHGGPAPNAENW